MNLDEFISTIEAHWDEIQTLESGQERVLPSAKGHGAIRVWFPPQEGR